MPGAICVPVQKQLSACSLMESLATWKSTPVGECWSIACKVGLVPIL
jgi:hypothetical protein